MLLITEIFKYTLCCYSASNLQSVIPKNIPAGELKLKHYLELT